VSVSGANSLAYLTAVNAPNGAMTRWLNCRSSGAPTDTGSLALAQLLKPYTNLFYKIRQSKCCECIMSVQQSVCMSSRVRYEQHGLLKLCYSSGVIRRLRTVAARVRDQVNSWVICVRQWSWGRLSESTSVSHANSYSTECSTVTYHGLGLVK
jgi:hypothetical protein